MTNSGHTSDISVRLIAREMTPVVWLLVRERISKAIAGCVLGEYDADDVRDDLVLGRKQLWLVTDQELNIKIVAITKIVEYPKIKRLFLDIIEGEGVMEALHLLIYGDRWMRQFGATQIEAHCKPGLARLLRRAGGHIETRNVLIWNTANADLPTAERQVEQG